MLQNITACVIVRVSYKSQRVSNFHSSRSTATKNCLIPSSVNSSLTKTNTNINMKLPCVSEDMEGWNLLWIQGHFTVVNHITQPTYEMTPGFKPFTVAHYTSNKVMTKIILILPQYNRVYFTQVPCEKRCEKKNLTSTVSQESWWDLSWTSVSFPRYHVEGSHLKEQPTCK